MTDQEILKILLENQEWQTFECKRAAILPSKLLETVIAFANSDGGLIVLGLDDPEKEKGLNRLIGISENPDNISEFLKLIHKEIDPSNIQFSHFEIEIENINKQKDKLIVVNIKKSNDVHSLKKGDTFVRRGRQNVKIGASEITRLKYDKGSIHFESETSGKTTLDELDIDLIRRYQEDTSSKEQEIWLFLKDNGLAIKKNDSYELTKAGVLLFGKNPAVILGNKCSIKVSHYYGTKPTHSGESNFVRRPFTIEGPLLYLVQKTLEYFKSAVQNSPPKLVGATFQPSLMVPEWAFQEAITNAVIHRNYFIQNDIQIRFFDDRIEIESPGSYPGHITTNNIRYERFARNPLILRTLNRFKFAPNLDIGEGVDRMFKVMAKSNLYEPLYMPTSLRPNSVLLFLFNLVKIEYWDTVSKYLDNNYKITNKNARQITGIVDAYKVSKLFKLWVNKNLLDKVESGFRGETYYKKVGVEIPKKLNKPFASDERMGK
ncbi:MAG: putative DNA binding domain-containing protein [bacterium]|nr:putative DNA binding domain-containing protein [bacterium]